MTIHGFECNMFGENTYIAYDQTTKDAIIIDPGMMSDKECEAIDNFIADNSLKLMLILLTHLHIDHVMGTNHIKEKYGVKIYANEADAFLGSRIAEQIQMFHLPVKLGKVIIDNYISDGDEIKVGNDTLICLSTPGHSPGSMSFYSSKTKAVFTGDALFKQAIGRTDLPGGNYAQLIASITNKILTLPDNTTIIPGHGPLTTVSQEKQFNPYF